MSTAQGQTTPQGQSTAATPAPRRRHLMDPNAPRKKPDPEAMKRLETVQRRVISAVVLTTVGHMVAGFIIAADHVNADRLDAQIGLNVIAAAFGVGGIAGTLVLNRRSPWSWWLLLGVIPSIFGIWWICF
ncbi:hypothetical protein [Nocardioides sp. YIM 152588]|uniref:hypothetical protein n=1 Tax=Nocardioides sp. YIM 152588 TaxID=3158259 RepID=UPI0032E418E7